MLRARIFCFCKICTFRILCWHNRWEDMAGWSWTCMYSLIVFSLFLTCESSDLEPDKPCTYFGKWWRFLLLWSLHNRSLNIVLGDLFWHVCSYWDWFFGEGLDRLCHLPISSVASQPDGLQTRRVTNSTGFRQPDGIQSTRRAVFNHGI